MNEDDKLLLSVNDAMYMMSISRRTFYGLINSGQLESLKIGSKRLIPKDSIEKYIKDKISLETKIRAILKNETSWIHILWWR